MPCCRNVAISNMLTYNLASKYLMTTFKIKIEKKKLLTNGVFYIFWQTHGLQMPS